MPTGTLLVAHGSSIAGHAEMAKSLAASVGDASGEPCLACFLDHNAPTVDAAVASLVAQGATQIVAVPLLLSKAFHAKVDVPKLLSQAAARYEATITIADPVGPDERLGLVLARRIEHASSDPASTVVVFSAGTGSEQARQQFEEFVAQWSTRYQRSAVAAFVAGGEPSVSAAVAQALTEGRTVVAAPFLLTDGVLLQRATDEALMAGAQSVAGALGVSDELIAIVQQRRQACASI